MRDQFSGTATEIETSRARLAEMPLDVAAHVDLARALFQWFETLSEDVFAEQDLAEPYVLLRDAIGLAEGTERAGLCAELGLGLAAWFDADQLAVQDRDEAIHLLTEAVSGLAPERDLEVEITLVDLLLSRAYTEDGDYSVALQYAQDVLAVAEDPLVPLIRLGFGHLMRHEAGGREDDLRAAERYLRQLADLGAADVAGYAAITTAQVTLLDVQQGDAAPRVNRSIVELDGLDGLDDVQEARRWTMLAVLRAARFGLFGGDEQDYDAAIAGLAEFADRPGNAAAQVATCQMFIAQLTMIKSLPPALRRDPAGMGQHELDGIRDAISVEEFARATAQFGAIDGRSLQGTEFAGQLSLMQAAHLATADVSENKIDSAIAELSGNDDTSERALAKAVLLVRKRQLDGGRENEAAGLTEFTKAVASIDPRDPLREMALGVLGKLTSGWDIRPGDAAETIATGDALAKAMAVLPEDHPARTDSAARVALASLLSLTEDRSSQSIDATRELVAQAVRRPSGDATTDAVNLLAYAKVAGLQGYMNRDIDMVDDAIAHLERASETVSPEQPIAGLVGVLRPGLLLIRSQLSGSLEDLDAAQHYTEQDDDAPGRPDIAGIQEMIRIATTFIRDQNELDEDLLARKRAEFTGVLGQLPPGDPLATAVTSLVDQLEMMEAAVTLQKKGRARTRADVQRLDDAVSSVLGGLTSSSEQLLYVHDIVIAAMSLAGQGLQTGHMRTFDQAMSLLNKVATRPDLVAHEEASIIQSMGMTLRMRYLWSRDHRDINNAIALLERSRRMAIDAPDGIDAAALLHSLADSYHCRSDAARGDLVRVVQVGLEAARERAADVLLQTSDRRALDTARSAKDEAAEIAHWCVAAGRVDAAVQALEIGRAMVLHSTTFETTLGTLLRESGHHDIAAQYEADVAIAGKAPWNETSGAIPGLAPSQLRTDLRRRVLKAVADTDIADHLRTPPTVADIAGALRKTGATALIYLVPNAERVAGMAVIVQSTGTVQALTLPKLTIGPEIERFEHGRQYAIDDLCDWAWPAVMEEVLDALAGAPAGPRPRLVLVSVGRLGSVPWHAARREIPGRAMRYACQDATISYASSARQFIEAGHRPTRDWSVEPVIVGVPGNGLHWAQKEIKEIHRRNYPGGVLFGTSVAGRNRVTPGKIRQFLPGGTSAASLLHLGCHGRLTERPMESYLALSANEDSEHGKLRIQEMLASARTRKSDEPGGLVVLAACTSDRTEDMPDEVLTLASTFLTAGAVGVVGTRWEVDDLATAFFMIMFHHYLTAGYPDPATALRATQVWMLDPNHRLPGDVDPVLAEELTSIDLAAIGNWAAFTYQGR